MSQDRVKWLLDGAGRRVALQFQCPGCGSTHSVGVEGVTPPNIGGARWMFNGDMARPMLEPSILERAGWYAEPHAVLGLQHDAATCIHCQLDAEDGLPPGANCHSCHSYVGCNGALTGQIIILADSTHNPGTVHDLPVIGEESEEVSAR